MRYTRMMLSISVFVLATSHLGADEQESIAEIEKIGGTVRKIAQNTDEQEAAFHLSGKDLTDEGLVHLKEISNLVWLNLANTKITDEGLAQLSDIGTLTRLHLEKTQIGDAGLAHLAGLENLEYLNLYGTQVSDAGLDRLKGLKKLKKLYLWQSKATPAGAKKVKDALVDVDINLGAEFEKVVTYDKLLAAGQYVRVRLEGDKRILQLAEVQVFEKGSGEELQKSGTSRQSSDYDDAKSARAHDGNTEQDYNKKSVSHTQEEKDPWWLIDLGGQKEIARITVFNRGDCCGDRLEGAVVDVLDASLQVVWSGKVEEAKDGSESEFAPE